MKKLVSLFVALAFVAGISGVAVAQTTAPKSGDTMKSDTKSGDKMAGEKKMAAKHAKGTVKSATADSIVVSGKDKGKDAEWTFAVDAGTKIKKGGKDVTASDVKAGDSVDVRYGEKDGKMMAQAVTVRGGGMAKKAEKGDAKNPCAAKK